jgi:hypothetical protein
MVEERGDFGENLARIEAVALERARTTPGSGAGSPGASQDAPDRAEQPRKDAHSRDPPISEVLT